VIKVEGLRSPKAIAFIRNSLETITYFTVRASPQQATKFFKTKFPIEIKLNVSLMEKIGEKNWIK
jgi:hypothetical protein